MLTIKAEYIKSLKHRFRLVSSLLSLMLYMGFTANAFAVNFSAVTTFELSNTSPKDVELTDLDGDGFPDMVFTMSGARSGDASIDIHYGDSVGGLNNGAITQLNYSPENITVGDFNNDGINDIAVTATSLSSPGVRVYIQGRNAQLKGNRAFSLAPVIILPSTFPDGIVSSDFDGDGLVDLVVNTINGGMFFALGNGDGTFSTMTAVTNTVGLQGRDLAIADFNNDLLLDLATPIGIFLGSNTGNFIKSAVQGGGVAIATGDLNNDGNIDTVSTGSDAIVVSLGNGDGTFNALPIIFATNASFKDAVIADINFDGFNDLIITKQIPNTGDVQGFVEVLLGFGDGTFDTALSYPVGINPEPLAIGDINSDGFLDFVTGNDDPLQTNATFALQIQATPPANIAPVASSLNLSTIERTPIAFTLFARDANKDPLTFSYSLPQSGGTLTGTAPDLVYTAPAGFSGTDTFTFTAQDPSLAVSNVATVSITVTIPNTAPDITAQGVISANEDTDLFFTTSKFTIVDQEDLAFTLRLLPPATNANYTVFGNRLTPAKNFSGILSVPLVVNDGTIDSAVFNAVVTINAVNDAPVITGQKPLATQEENALLLSLADLVVTDVDSSAFTMNVLAPATNANYTVTGKTITPKLNYNGTLKVSVRVSDGTDNSAIFNASVIVTAVNDAPVITGQQPLSTLEDQALTLSIADLIITDVDNAGGFALSVLQPAVGANYTVLGNTITPAAFFNGQLSVSVQVDDGNTNSNIFLLVISVIPVNTAPVITGQVQLNGKEDTSFTLQVSDFSISDVDSNAFTLSLLAPASGSNYTAVGTTITPAPNYNGSLVVPVRVSDGTDNSAIFNASVTIAAVNDAPVITGQKPLSTLEDQALTLSIANLTISDIDSAGGFILTVLPPPAGANYTVLGNTITPTAFFNGQLAVRVQVNDGSANSNIFSLAISVTPVNNVPVITGQVPLSSNEDTSLTLKVSDFNINDPDSNAFTLSVVAPGSGANYTVVGATVTPVANYNGLLTVPVTVKDETNSSATFNASVTISAVNDAPVITGQKPLSTLEDQALTLSTADLTVTDIDTVSGFSLSVLPAAAGANYTVSGNTITPTAFFNGQLSVRVQVNDGSANSNIFSLAISVTPVNNAPVITGQGQLSSKEDTKVTLQVTDFSISDVDSNAFTLSLLAPAPGSNYTVVGTTITPTPNYNGSLVVPVRVSDGTDNSAVFNAFVTISAVNDAPEITGQKPLSTLEDQALTLSTADLNIADVDTAGGFILTVLPPAAGANYSAVATTITPAALFNGQLSVRVLVNDGSANSNIFSLIVNVTSVNNEPVITGQGLLSSQEDTALTLQVSDFTIADPDSNAFTLSVLAPVATANYTVQGTKITPKLNYNGVLVVPVTVSDGTNNSATFNATVNITAVNDAPVANAGINQTAIAGDVITLDGSGSTDADGNTLLYYWVVTNKPIGSTLILSDVSAMNPTTTVELPGVYSLNLYVFDGFVVSDFAEVSVTVSVNTSNTAPIADSKVITTDEDLAVAIVLSGSDAEQNPLSYVIVNQPLHGTIEGISPNLTYTPFVDYNGADSFTYKTNDGALDSIVADVSITVKPVNDAPVANAGANKTVFVGDTITLDGSGSTDVDGNQLIYYWIANSKPAGSTLFLSNVSVVNPSVTIDLPGVYTFILYVYDGFVVGPTDTVVFTTANSAPVADAGPNQSVLVGSDVALSASGSTDIDGNPLTYSWTLASVPTASAAVLSDTLTINPTFNADFPGIYVAELIVNDGSVDSDPVTVTISTINSAPIANPGADQSVFTGDLVTLDGSASSDVDGNALTYRWALTSTPVDSIATLSNPLGINPTFTVDFPGTYVAQLIVNDGAVDSTPVTVSITTSNSAPVANPGADQSIFSGDLVILDGSASTDADNDPLNYSWSLTTPAGSSANLSDQFAINPTFTVDVSGIYVAQLIVNDGIVNSVPVNVLISTSNTNTAPISNPGVDQLAFTDDLVALNGIASSDADNDTLSYSWSLTVPAGSGANFSNQFVVDPTFIVDVAGTYVAQLIVNDGVIDSLPVTVTITVIDPVNVNIWSLMWKSGDQELIMKGDSGSANLEITYTSNAAPITTINNGGGGKFEDKTQLSIAPCAITVSTNSGFVLLDNIAVSGAPANDCQ